MNLATDRSAGEGMVVVRVADQVNQALTGHPGCRYESPPQCRQQALALVDLLLGHARMSLEGSEQWSCPIAGGKRTVTLVPLGWDHDTGD